MNSLFGGLGALGGAFGGFGPSQDHQIDALSFTLQQQQLGVQNVQFRQAAAQNVSNPFNAPSLSAGAGNFGGMPSGSFGASGAFPGEYRDPDDELEREVVYGELIGWRFWVLANGGFGPESDDPMGRLKSPMMGTIWTPGEVIKGYPSSVTLQGINAYKRQDQIEISVQLPCTVVGTVEMWGDVIEYEFGYRSEYAAIKSIHEIHHPKIEDWEKLECLNSLRREYGLETT